MVDDMSAARAAARAAWVDAERATRVAHDARAAARACPSEAAWDAVAAAVSAERAAHAEVWVAARVAFDAVEEQAAHEDASVALANAKAAHEGACAAPSEAAWAGASSARSAFDACRRVALYRVSLDAEADWDTLARVLGAGDSESVIDAARRVVRERDEARGP